MIRSLRNDLVVRVAANFGSRAIAIVALALATVLVARAGGAATVGSYALLRMLSGVLGVVAVLGLPSSMAYFLAGRPPGPRSWPTYAALSAGGALLGTLLWLVLSPLLAHWFFPRDSTLVIAVAALTVGTQLVLTVAKNVLQGLHDNHGADTVIAAEEVAFLPVYGAAWGLGLGGTTAVIVGLAGADLLVGAAAWWRVGRLLGWRRLGIARHPHGWWGRPDPRLAREVASYGTRGQVGGLMTLVNLRLDFAILGVLAGPAVLGVYAVASKFAELLRLPGTAVTWVLYPRFAAGSDDEVSQRARRLVRPVLLATAAAAIPVALLVAPVIHLLYGAEFVDAIGQARVLLVGMLLAGGAGVASGYLFGRGHPGLNSLAMAVGLVLTVVLDVLLIPRHGAMGAAVASTVSYLVTDFLLITLMLRLSARSRRPTTAPSGTVEVPS
jgi:O-antigen/teichoic acid export membrane protein